jgi:uncharacterized membrane protein YbhN (UPF0104 family)
MKVPSLTPRQWLAARVVTSGALLAVVVWGVPATDVSALPLGRAAAALPVIAALLVGGQCLAALRWRVVIGSEAPPWRHIARLYLVGGFFSLFLPTLVGGDAFRAAAASRKLPPGSAFASVLLDRFLGVAALMLYGLVGLFLAPAGAAAMIGGAHWEQPGAALSAALVASMAAVTLAIAFVPAVRRFAGQLRAVVVRLALAPRDLALALGLGLVVQGVYIAAWMLAAAALNVQLAVSTFLLAVPLVTLGGMLPVSIAGLGLRENAWLLLLRGSGIPPARVVAFSMLFFAGTMLAGAVGGLVFALRGIETPGDPETQARP